MKKRILTIAFLSIGLSAFVSCSEDDDTNSEETLIDAQDLPENAKTFVSTYFADAEYSRVEKNMVAESDGTLYEVDLNNNFEIDFTAEGDWKDIDGNNQEIPAGIIPENIANYAAENYAGLFITGIDSEPNGFEVELSNDLDLRFDLDGNFVSEEQ